MKEEIVTTPESGRCYWWCNRVTCFAFKDERGTFHCCLQCYRQDSVAKRICDVSVNAVLFYRSWEE